MDAIDAPAPDASALGALVRYHRFRRIVTLAAAASTLISVVAVVGQATAHGVGAA